MIQQQIATWIIGGFFMTTVVSSSNLNFFFLWLRQCIDVVTSVGNLFIRFYSIYFMSALSLNCK